MVLKKTKKIAVNLQISEETLAYIDEIAEKEQRNRTNFMIFATLRYCKQLELDYSEEKDKKEGWENVN